MFSDDESGSTVPLLYERFQGLNVPEAGEYSGIRLDYENYVIARDASGRPALFIRHSEAPGRQNQTYALEGLEAILQYDAVIRLANHNISGLFALIRCSSDDDHVKRYFVELCGIIKGLLGVSPTASQIDDGLNTFVRMFALRKASPRQTVVGLIGELLFIDQSAMVVKSVNAWRINANDLIDFVFPDYSVEVKCTTSMNRIHTVTYEQVAGLTGLNSYFLSVRVTQVANGMSGARLLEQLVERCGDDASAAIRVWEMAIETMGSNIHTLLNFVFAYEASVGSMQYYDAADLPAIRGGLPAGVSRLQFASDFSLATPVDGQKRAEFGMR
jgi:hypothetical protein